MKQEERHTIITTDAKALCSVVVLRAGAKGVSGELRWAVFYAVCVTRPVAPGRPTMHSRGRRARFAALVLAEGLVLSRQR